MSDTVSLLAEGGTQAQGTAALVTEALVTEAQHAMPRSGTRRSPGARRASGVRYALRPVIVPESLDSLHGPVAGLVELPQRLFWSGVDRVFDLSDPDRVTELYEAVLDAARTEADLAEYLNCEVLIRLWPGLALAPRVRRAWEAVHWPLEATRQLGANPVQCPSGTSAVA